MAIQTDEDDKMDAAEMDPMDRIFSETESNHKSSGLLVSLLKGLSTEERTELTALAILGRQGANGSIKDWEQLLQNARAQQLSSDADTHYLSAMAPLGDYIMTGLKEMGYSL